MSEFFNGQVSVFGMMGPPERLFFVSIFIRVLILLTLPHQGSRFICVIRARLRPSGNVLPDAGSVSIVSCLALSLYPPSTKSW
jgi:hypothetical protein